MKVKLKFFGPLRDIAKVDEAEIEVKEKTIAGDLPLLIGEKYPRLREHLKIVSIAVNSEYASKNQNLAEGDEIGLLPPISGGRHG